MQQKLGAREMMQAAHRDENAAFGGCPRALLVHIDVDALEVRPGPDRERCCSEYSLTPSPKRSQPYVESLRTMGGLNTGVICIRKRIGIALLRTKQHGNVPLSSVPIPITPASR